MAQELKRWCKAYGVLGFDSCSANRKHYTRLVNVNSEYRAALSVQARQNANSVSVTERYYQLLEPKDHANEGARSFKAAFGEPVPWPNASFLEAEKEASLERVARFTNRVWVLGKRKRMASS